MRYKKLGNTDLDVSLICLGTMTWGEQNTPEEASEQLDYALGEGVNFIDVAELYPVAPKAETQGLSEDYIGRWLAKTGKRQDVILATKVTGRGDANLHNLCSFAAVELMRPVQLADRDVGLLIGRV